MVAAMEQILSTGLFVVEQEDLVRRSLESYRRGKGDFADSVIAETCAGHGCRDTATFDRALRGELGFVLLG